jgi:hypothetical protein
VPPSSGELSTQVCNNVFPTCNNLSKARQEQNLRNLENDNSGNGQGQKFVNTPVSVLVLCGYLNTA